MATIDGGVLNDSLVGNQFDDLIRGYGGDDTLIGNGGSDTLYGGAGDDVLNASGFADDADADRVFGGAGSDHLSGQIGDWLDGGADEDWFYMNLLASEEGVVADFTGVTTGAIALSGGRLGTVANCEHGAILLSQSDDVVRSGEATMFLDGFAGNDVLTLDAAGYLDGGTGNDLLTGSNGDDMIWDGWGGIDTISAGGGSDVIYDQGGNGIILGGDGDDQINHLLGGIALLRGGDGDDRIDSQGVDTISGGEGNDTIYAYGGQLSGGAGRDYIGLAVAFPTPQVIDLNGLAHGKTVQIGPHTSISGFETGSISFGFASATVNIGDADLTVTGGAGDDLITCGNGGDTVFGGGGADTMIAGAGDDFLYGERRADTLSYESATGGVIVDLHRHDRQNTGGSGADTVIGFDNIIGSDLGDTLTGTRQHNVLTGGSGNDILRGGLGADILVGGSGGDVFVFGRTIETAVGAADLVQDLESGDVIDIKGIDANVLIAGNQQFSLVDHLSGAAGQAVLSYDSGADRTSLILDTNGDGAADGVVLIAGDASGFTGIVL
jgi:Ca2+-binding RTX toxin-like protein